MSVFWKLGAANPLLSHHFPHSNGNLGLYPRDTNVFVPYFKTRMDIDMTCRGSLWITWPTSCGFGQPSFGSLAKASCGEGVFMSCIPSSMRVSNWQSSPKVNDRNIATPWPHDVPCICLRMAILVILVNSLPHVHHSPDDASPVVRIGFNYYSIFAKRTYHFSSTGGLWAPPGARSEQENSLDPMAMVMKIWEDGGFKTCFLCWVPFFQTNQATVSWTGGHVC